jgi:pSer/pThr/pTyr-binding forkhead associated (FHA) protein
LFKESGLSSAPRAKDENRSLAANGARAALSDEDRQQFDGGGGSGAYLGAVKNDPHATIRLQKGTKAQRSLRNLLTEYSLRRIPADLAASRTFLQQELQIGRDHGDLIVGDSSVSRQHAVIENYGPNQLYIKDLGSTNGVFVNAERVERRQLQDGDKPKFGEATSSAYDDS